jgi:hypothetical protein
MRANQKNASWAKKLKVVDFTGMELIGWSFFHTQTYTSAATLNLNWFNVAATSITNGNMKSNTLPAGHHFLIQAIRFCPLLDTRETIVGAPAAGAIDGAIEDMKELVYDGVAELFINEKPYGAWPLHQLPAGSGVTGLLQVPGFFITTDKTAQYSYAVNGLADPRAVYTLAVPIPVPPLTLLRFTATWDAAKTLSVGNSPIQVILDGQLLRPRTS